MKKMLQGIVVLLLGFSQIQAVFADIPLTVRETLGIDRVNEMIHNGIPVAENEQFFTTDQLIIEDDVGTQVPASFEVLSRWAGGRDDTDRAIQWLLVSFPATLSANTEKTYILKHGAPISPLVGVTLSETNDAYQVDTGAAQFVINKHRLTFFDAVLQNHVTLLAGNGGSHSTIAGQAEAPALAPNSVSIERQTAQYLVIKVQGDYGNIPVGPGSAKTLSYKIRYSFFAGSPTVIVYHKFFWSGYESEGSGRPSGNYFITVNNTSLTLPDMTGDCRWTVVGADQSTILEGLLSPSQTAGVAQRRRTLFADPQRAEVIHGLHSVSTPLATQPLLINRSDNGAIAVSMDHMQVFEPQSMETGHTGKIRIKVMSEPQYFANNQGTWARVGISALPPGASREDVLTYNYAPLNQRVFAFPTNAYVVSSQVFREVPITPDATSDPRLQAYYNEVKAVSQTTRTFLEAEKFHGLMVWGGMPRYNSPSEIGTGTGWDKIYSTGNLTDYHSAWNNVVFHFLLERDPSLLYDLSFMGARRMLHTQIIQPDWAGSSHFMGWGYAGYDRYRSDGNSAHSYFENLYNYYYLTGDLEVVDILRVGGEKQRKAFTRNNNALNDPISGGVDWSEHQGRIGSQFVRIFKFLGHVDNRYPHASDNLSFLQDFHHMFRHVFARSLFLQNDSQGNPEYAFYGDDILARQVFVSGTEAEQNWMIAMYGLNDLYGYYKEWHDPEVRWHDPGLGDVSLKTSAVYGALVNGLAQYVPTACSGPVCSGGDGTWYGGWANKLGVEFTGHRLNGTLTAVYPVFDGDAVLYSAGKSLMILSMLRAGAMQGDAALTTFGMEGLDYILGTEAFRESRDNPWEKTNAEMFVNLHHSLAYLNLDADLDDDGDVDGFDLSQYVSALIQGTPVVSLLEFCRNFGRN